jgi:large subunit ribosomal protein L2
MAKYPLLTKKEPEKSLVVKIKEKAGRNNLGRITSRHRGGGVKRLYRIVDFGQEKMGVPAKVVALEYDPYRTAFLMLLEYKDGEKRYQIAPHNIKIGQEVLCDEKTDVVVGNRMKLKNIPVGTLVYNIEIIPNKGGQLVRAAGSWAKVLAHEGKYTHLQMPSGEVRKVLQECFASIGQVSHPENRFEVIGKAGSSRRKGKRPHVRGSAMTPASHPHGGGEGKTPIGMKYPKTPWGKPARGVKTRKRVWTDKFIIKRRK